MNENLDKKKKRNLHRSLAAGVAMLAGVSAAEARDASDRGVPRTETLELLDTEDKILGDSIPLPQQIEFLEKALRAGGPYAHQLNSIRLSAARLSKIFSVANAVSARLTNAYSETRDDPQLSHYFKDVDVLKNATEQFRIAKATGNIVCNKYAVKDNDEFFEVTAFHCIKDSAYEQRFFHPDGTEIAVRNLSSDEVQRAKWDPNMIPEVHQNATSQNINGRVITAFSWDPVGVAKVHLSVAMPMPARRSLMFNAKEMHELGAYGVTDMKVFFKPYGEGLLKPETRRTNVAGSSGGPVFAEGLGILGNYSATKEITDKCINVCYATSFFSGPDVLQNAIQGERGQRASKPKNQ